MKYFGIMIDLINKTQIYNIKESEFEAETQPIGIFAIGYFYTNKTKLIEQINYLMKLGYFPKSSEEYFNFIDLVVVA